MLNLKNILLCVFAILGSITVAESQSWEQTYGTTEFEKGIDGIETSNGDFMILCSSNDTWTNVGAFNYFMRIDAAGNAIERDTLDGVRVQDLKSLDNGDFIVFGEVIDQTYGRPFIKRYDLNGDDLWTAYYPDTIDYGNGVVEFSHLNDVVELEDGSFFLHVVYDSFGPADTEHRLLKIDVNGGLIWDHSFEFGPGPFNGNFKLERFTDGNVFIIGNYDSEVMKIDADGNLIWSVEFEELELDEVVASPDGGMVFSNLEFGNYRKIDADGNHVDVYDPNLPIGSVELIALQDSSFLTCGVHLEQGNPNAVNNFVMGKVFPPANAAWLSRVYERPLNQYAQNVLEISDGGFLLIGFTESEIGGYNVFLIKTNADGVVGDHVVTGNIAYDLDLNCTIDSLESSLAGFYVVAQGQSISYGVSNSLGNYTLGCDLGVQTISVFPPNNYWGFCEEEVTVNLTELDGTTNLDFQAQAEVLCPALSVDIASPFIRRCFENNYYVSYCNDGTVTANDASVEVILDEHMLVTSTSIPISANVDSLYVFDVGDIEINECGNFVITFLLDEDCDSTVLGETHCVEAHIFPDDFCDLDTGWTGANVDLSASCGEDTLSFTIENTGTGDMAGPLAYIIIEDEVILRDGFFNLDIGESETINVPANGSTYRLEAEQEPSHPSDIKVKSITVEGCGLNEMAEISLGYVELFSDNDDDPFLSIDCQENVGAYDPNDKQASPVGFGDEHFINQNETIEYKVRFQNTGTDTAFNIVVLDTLSEFLNPLTVHPGVSSHPYQFSIEGNGILSFSFENIMLPDSNVNQVASNGFFTYTVGQFTDNPIGTEIFNSAAIYFDFNDPVITNTTWHTITEDYLLILSDQKVFLPEVEVKTYPNPFTEETVFELKGIEEQNLNLNIYNAIGQLVRSEKFENNRVLFQRDRLTTGVYFYNISNEEQVVANGKIIVQ